jgi:serine/threonine protein kinase
MLRKVGRYVLDHLISREATTVVWKATDEITGEPVALKIPTPHCTQIEVELKYLNELKHDHIISLLDTVETQFGTALVLPYAAGGNLGDYISATRLQPETVKQIGFTLLQALAYLHKKGLLHRDIKPENILVMDPANFGDSVVLADFGFCTEATNQPTDTCFGTFFYLPPECLESGAFDEKGDIWALGITLLACLTAVFPFNASSPETAGLDIVEGLPDLAQLMVDFDVPEEAAMLLKKMMARDSSERIAASEALESSWFDSLRSAEIAAPDESCEWEETP